MSITPTKRPLESTSSLELPMNNKQIQEQSQKLAQGLNATKKAQCEAKGGTWDETTGTCKLPEKTTKTEDVKPKTSEVFRDAETGKISGITLPSGETFLGIKPDEVRELNQNFLKDRTLPEGTMPAGTTQNEANRQARINQLVQLGQQGLITPQELQAIQEAPIDWGQAITAGSVGNLPSVISRTAAGAGAGAAAGAFGLGIGAVPGALIGGAAGLISAIWGGASSNIKKQQTGEINAARDVLTAAKTNMKALSAIVSQDPSRAEEAIVLYYDQLAQVQRAHRKVQLETQGNLNKFMDDGTDILSDFELFLQPGGYAELQLIRLQAASAGKKQASTEELLQLQEEYMNE